MNDWKVKYVEMNKDIISLIQKHNKNFSKDLIKEQFNLLI